jgi:hypothetical protein
MFAGSSAHLTQHTMKTSAHNKIKCKKCHKAISERYSGTRSVMHLARSTADDLFFSDASE